jgi:hypothetical protein
MLILLVAGLALAAAPRLVRAIAPLIGESASIRLPSVSIQPLAPFRCPEPFLHTNAVKSDVVASYFRSFVLDRSPLVDVQPRNSQLPISASTAAAASSPPSPNQRLVARIGPEEKSQAPLSVGLELEFLPEAPPQKAGKIAQTMPPAVVEAIGILLRKPPIESQMPVASTSPLVEEPIPDSPPARAAKLAAVTDSIAAFKESLAKPQPLLMPPLVVVTTMPTAAGSNAEEQEATRQAVAKASAQLLGQIELPKSLPAKIPLTELPAAPPAPTAPESTFCPTCLREFYFGRPLHRLKEARDAIGGCSTCGGGWRCSPGHEPCEACETHNGPIGRLFCDFYECLCCPDPCYEPHWRQIPNAALFVDGARPVTQTEVRWNSSKEGIFPDRSEYIWARADGKGKGPRPPKGALAEYHFDYDDLVLITETAKDKLSVIVAMPYRAVAPETFASGAGFGDMSIGTKTLLFDCELLQISMQMMTYLPIGNSLKGVGNGHVSLEPSLLCALKLTCDTYIQGQLSEWIPLGGDPTYMGSIFHTHFSVNHVVHRFGPAIPVVGTMEFNTYSFQDGAYTDPIQGSFQKSSATTYVSLGPGLRLFFCDKLDIGFGTAFAVSGDSFSREYYRTSVRFRF